jgi:hypothetical protein
MSGATVIVGVNEAVNELILKKTAIRQSVTSDYLKPNTCNTEIVSSVIPGRIQ